MGDDFEVLTVPGFTGSGSTHWQTAWERTDARVRRVEQRDWDKPVVGEWMDALEDAVRGARRPVILVGHSCGVLTIVHWARRGASVHRVAGALLVAPPDVDALAFPAAALTFSPVPRGRLPFRSIVIASANDPFCALDRAREFAGGWGSALIDIGPYKHINGADVGSFAFGYSLLTELSAVRKPPCRDRGIGFARDGHCGGPFPLTDAELRHPIAPT